MKTRFVFVITIGSAMALGGCREVTTHAFLSQSTLEGVSITTFQKQPRAAWRMDDSGKVHTASRILTFQGTCYRGQHSVQFRFNGENTGPAVECTNDQKFTWTHTLSSDGEFKMTVHPRTRGGTVDDQSIGETLIVDTLPPAPPIIVTNGGLDFISKTRRVEIQGTVNPDTRAVEGEADQSALSFMDQMDSFDYFTKLAQGETRTLAFFAVDFAGNRSAPATITVSYLPSTRLELNDFSGLSVRRGDRSVSLDYELQNATMPAFMADTDPLPSVSTDFELSIGMLKASEAQEGN